MSQEPLKVEFRVELRNKRPSPKPAQGANAKRQQLDRAARRARNLALAYWIDGLIRTGQVADLAAVARMCGVSRAAVSQLLGDADFGTEAHEVILAPESCQATRNR